MLLILDSTVYGVDIAISCHLRVPVERESTYKRIAELLQKTWEKQEKTRGENRSAVSDRDMYIRKGADYFKERGVLNKNLAKERVYSELLRDLLPQGAIVADIGSAVGYLTFELKKIGLNPIGLDLSHKMLKQAADEVDKRKLDNIPYIQGDALALPFQDASLDAMVITNVLEHFTTEEAVYFLKQARRVLKENGRILIGTPVKSPITIIKLWFRKLFDPYVWRNRDKVIDDTGDLTHKVWYTNRELFSLLKNEGFQLEKSDYFIYRTSEWPRGNFVHWLQKILDKYDSRGVVKKQLAFGMYVIAKNLNKDTSSPLASKVIVTNEFSKPGDNIVFFDNNEAADSVGSFRVIGVRNIEETRRNSREAATSI